MNRLYIVLSGEERTALQTMAEQERRDPRVQAALLIRHGLEHAGLLATSERRVQSEDTTETKHNRQPDAYAKCSDEP